MQSRGSKSRPNGGTNTTIFPYDIQSFVLYNIYILDYMHRKLRTFKVTSHYLFQSETPDMALPQFLGTMSKSHKKPLTCLLILLSLYHSSSRDTLTPTQYLSDGGILISSGGTFALGFFTPANSSNNNRYIGIWYNKIPGRAVIWVANRLHPIYGTTGTLSITPNGSLLVSNGNSTDIWLFASTTQVPNPIAQLLDTGNFIVADRSDPNSIAWQSFDYPTDTLIPGMKLGWDLKSGLHRNLTAWSSPTDPSPGNYTLAVDLHGDPQVIYWAGSVREWRSGPWNGIIPYNDPNSLITFSFIFVKNEEEVSYTVDVVNNSTLTRLVIDSFGIGKRFVVLESGRWAEYWRLVVTRCDSFNVCGPYGVCHIGASLLCSCLPGFEPKSPYLWSMGDYSGGCIRKNALDCRNRTDGFVKVQKTVLPDTVKATVERRMSLDECRAECLRNCSCNGFASDDINGNGCIIWFTDLLDVEMYSTGGQEFYLRLAAADIGMYCLSLLISCLLVLIYCLRNCNSFTINHDYGAQFYPNDNGKVSIVADLSFLNSYEHIFLCCVLV